MGDLTPVIEGPVKFRDGKKWKPRYASVTRLSPVADSLTLQLWKDRRDYDRHPPSKGSLSLQGYLGWEAAFTLEKESLTLAIILSQAVIVLAFDSRETLMRWQVRVTSQFEEGQHFTCHVIQTPPAAAAAAVPAAPRAKLCSNSVTTATLHLQNGRFSLTTGVPPKLWHTWQLVDLRRYGALDSDRFCFEGGSRCGKGEGVHVIAIDQRAEFVKENFDLATKNRLENKRKGVYKSGLPSSPSNPSDLCDQRITSTDALSTIQMLPNCDQSVTDGGNCSRSRSRSRSINWSSGEGRSSCETSSVALSELGGGSGGGGGGRRRESHGCHSPNPPSCSTSAMLPPHPGPEDPPEQHLVNRRALLERMGMTESLTDGSSSNKRATTSGSRSTSMEYPQWCMTGGNGISRSRGQATSSFSMDRISVSSHESQSSSNYDSPRGMQQCSSVRPAPGVISPALTPKTQRRLAHMKRQQQQSPPPQQQQQQQQQQRHLLAAVPCGCQPHQGSEGGGYENYDIPRNLGRQESLQFYDTPRSVKEALQSLPSYGNYDFPSNGGALPVYRKQCGCVMKLVRSQEPMQSQQQSEESEFVWTCVKRQQQQLQKVPGQPSHPQQQCQQPQQQQQQFGSFQKVRLTGQGRMPVADMRHFQQQQRQQQHSLQKVQQCCCPDRGRLLTPTEEHPVAPKSPVYAVVNKTAKNRSVDDDEGAPKASSVMGSSKIQHQHNYCNIGPSLGDVVNRSEEQIWSRSGDQMYENTKNVLQRLQLEQDLERGEEYLSRFSVHPAAKEPELPFIPFQPPDISPGTVQHYCDSINRKLREFHDSLNECQDEDLKQDCQRPPMLPPKSKSTDDLERRRRPLNSVSTSVEESSSMSSRFVTIPRSKDGLASACPIFMRRSASVPCKRPGQRGSTSSSDSGFSTGSPPQARTARVQPPQHQQPANAQKMWAEDCDIVTRAEDESDTKI